MILSLVGYSTREKKLENGDIRKDLILSCNGSPKYDNVVGKSNYDVWVYGITREGSKSKEIFDKVKAYPVADLPAVLRVDYNMQGFIDTFEIAKK